MAQYIPTLEFYCNGLPLVSMGYGSCETLFGVNLDPLCKPQGVSYTIMPNMSYFEFLPVDGNHNETVDLADVNLGRFYEVAVINFYGLYGSRVGDIVQVTGFYNNSPQFRFIRRENVVLIILGSVGIMLMMDFTSYADVSNAPGHYVFYTELKSKNEDGHPKMGESILTDCCFAVEESLDVFYRRMRGTGGCRKVLQPSAGQYKRLRVI